MTTTLELQQTNARLARENAELRAQVSTQQYDLAVLRKRLVDCVDELAYTLTGKLPRVRSF